MIAAGRRVTVGGPAPDSLGRAGLSTLVVSVLSVGIGFASSVVTARALGPEGKGALSLATTSAELVVMVVGGASIAAGATLAVARGAAAPRPLVVRLLGIAGLQTVAALALLAVASQTVLAGDAFADGRGLATLSVIGALAGATCAYFYLRSVLVGLQQFVAANWRDLVGRSAGVALLVAAVVVADRAGSGATPQLLLVAIVGGTLVTAGMMAQAVSRLSLERHGNPSVRVVVDLARPLYARTLVQFLNYRLDVFLVAALVGLQELGLYTLAVTVAQLLWVVSNSIASVLLPRAAAATPDVAAREAARLTRITLLVGVCGATLLAIGAAPFIAFMYGPAFAGAVGPLLILLPGVVAYGAVKVLESYIAGVGRLRVNLIISVIALGATVSLDLLLIPSLGATGAAFASTVSYATSAAATIGWSVRFAGIPPREFLIVTRPDLALGRSAVRRMLRWS